MLRPLILGCVIALGSNYATAQELSLKQNMKQMKMDFEQAAESPDIESMRSAIDSLQVTIEEAKRGDYPEDVSNAFLGGFNKLEVILAQIEADLDEADLQQAKSKLREIDELRKEYHKKYKQ